MWYPIARLANVKSAEQDRNGDVLRPILDGIRQEILWVTLLEVLQ
jgi:hypothetical protein